AALPHNANSLSRHQGNGTTGMTDPVENDSGPTTSPIASFSGDGVYATDDLWYFDGETPPYYNTQITLTLTTQYPGPYSWTITAGTDKVVFGNGSSTYQSSSSTDRSATLISTAGSTPADTLAYDISITVSTQFGQVAMAQMAVPTPRRLVPVGR